MVFFMKILLKEVINEKLTNWHIDICKDEKNS